MVPLFGRQRRSPLSHSSVCTFLSEFTCPLTRDRSGLFPAGEARIKKPTPKTPPKQGDSTEAKWFRDSDPGLVSCVLY